MIDCVVPNIARRSGAERLKIHQMCFSMNQRDENQICQATKATSFREWVER